MKKLLYVSIALIAGIASTYFMSAQHSVNANQDLMSIARDVAKDYRSEQGFDWACYVWGQQVSLWAMIYAITLQEWGYKKGTVWYNTNNRGSLHSSMWLKKTKWVVTADWSTRRPIYHTVNDWLYEKAHLIVTGRLYNKCNFGFNQLYSYVVWPNADPNKIHPLAPSSWECRTNKCYIQYLFWNMKRNAEKYDAEILWVPPSDWSVSTDTYTPTHDAAPKAPSRDHKNCYYVDTIRKADFIQFDVDWELYDFKHIGREDGKNVDVFNCYGEMR